MINTEDGRAASRGVTMRIGEEQPAFNVTGNIQVNIIGGMTLGGRVGVRSDGQGPGMQIEDHRFIGTGTALQGVNDATIVDFHHDAQASRAEQRRAFEEWMRESREIIHGHPVDSHDTAVQEDSRPGENREARRRRHREKRKLA